MKIKTSDVIKEIYEDKDVFKTNHIFKYGKNKLEVVFIDKTEYEQSLNNQAKGSIYLYDHKGFNHLLLIRKNDYENRFSDLYTPQIILNNLKLFVYRRKTQKFGKTTYYITLALIALINTMYILQYTFKKVFYITIISIIVAILLFLLNGKIILEAYKKEQKRLMDEVLLNNPELNKLIKKEVNYAKKKQT